MSRNCRSHTAQYFEMPGSCIESNDKLHRENGCPDSHAAAVIGIREPQILHRSALVGNNPASSPPSVCARDAWTWSSLFSATVGPLCCSLTFSSSRRRLSACFGCSDAHAVYACSSLRSNVEYRISGESSNWITVANVDSRTSFSSLRWSAGCSADGPKERRTI